MPRLPTVEPPGRGDRETWERAETESERLCREDGEGWTGRGDLCRFCYLISGTTCTTLEA